MAADRVPVMVCDNTSVSSGKESGHLLVIERDRAKERQIRKPESVPATLPEQKGDELVLPGVALEAG